MFKITNRQILSTNIKRLTVLAPQIAVKTLPGQFVVVTFEPGCERIPLSVVETDPDRGTITLIIEETGATTRKLGNTQINDEIYAILGPLGNPATVQKFGTTVCVASGIEAAQILSICRALKKFGNKVVGIIGAKTRRLLVLEAQVRLSCNKFFIATEDGSYERRGLATHILKKILTEERVDAVYATGSVDMMETCAAMTREKNVKTFVYVNPVMADGTGECGSCRVRVGGEIRLACVDGPEFDGHQMDFADLRIRCEAAGVQKAIVLPVKSSLGQSDNFVTRLRSWVNETIRS